MPGLNRLAQELGESPTMAAASVELTHPDPIDLSVGEPAEPPQPSVIEAACRALREGRSRYGPAAGLKELRDRVASAAAARRRAHGSEVRRENVIMTPGGKAALMLAMQCTLAPGDEVVLITPYWPTFAQQVAWCRAKPLFVDGRDELLGLEAVVTSRTRMIVFNQPSNPTAEVYTRRAVRRLLDVAERHDLWILSDEVYRELAFDGACQGPVEWDPSAECRTITVESFSKRFSMTGYRLGCAIAPVPVVDAMTRLTTALTTHASTISQYAGLAAYELNGDWERVRLEHYRRRRDLCVAGLRRVVDVHVSSPPCALYVFPRVNDLCTRLAIDDDVELCRALAREQGLKLVPGSVFGAPGHIRLSYGVAEDRLEEALARIADFANGPRQPRGAR